jgi:UDP-N-acetylglucosamine pyrophosphorylase
MITKIMNNERKVFMKDGSYVIFNGNRIHSDKEPAIYVKKNDQYLFYINGKHIPFTDWIKKHCTIQDNVIKFEYVLKYG